MLKRNEKEPNEKQENVMSDSSGCMWQMYLSLIITTPMHACYNQNQKQIHKNTKKSIQNKWNYLYAWKERREKKWATSSTLFICLNYACRARRTHYANIAYLHIPYTEWYGCGYTQDAIEWNTTQKEIP